MSDPAKIPFLIKLLDEDNPELREKIIQELSLYGPLLFEEIKRLTFSLNTLQQENLKKVFKRQKNDWIKKVWPTWFQLRSELEKLEGALSILSQFLSPPNNQDYINILLDELAEKYRAQLSSIDAKQLAHFLFKDFGLKGNESDYDNPQNSNLVYVIKEKKGIPISLASIYMLTGARLGLLIEGCNFPGHFLARVEYNGRKVMVDCFHGGQFIEEADILKAYAETKQNMKQILEEAVDAEIIVRRFLANLIRSFHIHHDEEDGELMVQLFRELDHHHLTKKFDNLKPEDIVKIKKVIFKVGQVIIHKRYGYRGVIVDYDLHCKASDNWYYGNQSQPERDQPWYHVLVHASDQVTYVAESHLVEDISSEKITHPLLTYFFTRGKEGQYIRNQNPWPQTDF